MNRIIFFTVPITAAVFFLAGYVSGGQRGLLDTYNFILGNLGFYLVFSFAGLVAIYLITTEGPGSRGYIGPHRIKVRRSRTR